MSAMRIAAGLAIFASVCLAGVARSSPLEAASQPAPAFELIRVAANTGTAAGGHVALRVGGRVYHHQAGDDGLLRFERDDWAAFQLRYRVLGNRGLEAHRLSLNEEAARRLEARLAQLHAVERLALDRLEALELEQRWFEALGSAGASLLLPGAGLFERAGAGDDASVLLRAAVKARHGEAFLSGEIARAEAALREGALLVSAAEAGPGAGGGAFPMAPVEAERRRRLLLLREALSAIEGSWPLAPEALLDPDAALGLELSPDQHASLTHQSEQLEASVLRLVTSPRADRGEALLLAVARHQAARRSLAQGRLLLLDPTPDGAPVVGVRALRERRQSLLRVLPTLRDAFVEARGQALTGRFDELRHHHLEAAAAFLLSFGAASEARGPVRLFMGGASPPSRSGPVPIPELSLPAGRREGALAVAAERRDRARRSHEYALLRHNCATELARAIVSAFPDPERAARALGGELDPDAGLHFWPAAFARSARHTWSIDQTRELPSWRREQVAGYDGNRMLVALRESNTWTAHAYQRSSRDGAFLFFSDGAVLLRPLQGVANLGYGLAHAGVGLLTLPFDRGRLAWSGLRGALYSVPELVGINIRKGTHELPPLDVVAKARSPIGPAAAALEHGTRGDER